VRRVLSALAVTACALGLLGLPLVGRQPAHGHAAGAPPNFVVVLTDDQRWDSIGYMPTVSALAARNFPNGFVTTPLCCPSRSSILTGRYAHNHGVLSNNAPLGSFTKFQDTDTIATRLHNAGYRTGLFGKYLNGYGNTTLYIPPGWDTWFAFNSPLTNAPQAYYYNYTVNANGVQLSYGSSEADYGTDVLATQAEQFIRTSDPRPFFVYIAPYAPHEPSIPASRHANLFNDLSPWRPPSYNEADVSDKPAWLASFPLLTPTQQSTGDTSHKNMLRSLQAVDDLLAGVIQALQDTGQLDNTAIFFLSDNGLEWGEHRLLNHKSVPYQEAVRVPFLIAYPPLTPSRVDDPHVVLNIDLAPTMLDLAGQPIPITMDGVSLVPLLNGTATTWRTDWLEEHWSDVDQQAILPSWSAVHSLLWNYVEYDSGDRELYDLTNDPYELNNVAGQSAYASVQADRAARLAVLKGSGVAPQGRTEDGNTTRIQYTGVWKKLVSSAYSQGTARSSATPSSTAVFSWSGTGVTVVMARDSSSGIAHILVDGVAHDIDLYSPTPQYQQPVLMLDGLPSGAHQLQVSPSGSRNPSSKGFNVALDAIDTR